ADRDTLRNLYRRYEFNAALKDLEAVAAEQPGEASANIAATSPATIAAAAADAAPDAALGKPGEHELIVDAGRFDAWLGQLRHAELISFDTETTSIDSMRAEIVGVSFAVEAGKAA